MRRRRLVWPAFKLAMYVAASLRDAEQVSERLAYVEAGSGSVASGDVIERPGIAISRSVDWLVPIFYWRNGNPMNKILLWAAPACAVVVFVSQLTAVLTAADKSASSGDHSAASAADAAANPKEGFREYKDAFKVQQPYDLKRADRFSEDGPVYTCWVNKSDKPFKEGSATGRERRCGG